MSFPSFSLPSVVPSLPSLPSLPSIPIVSDVARGVGNIASGLGQIAGDGLEALGDGIAAIPDTAVDIFNLGIRTGFDVIDAGIGFGGDVLDFGGDAIVGGAEALAEGAEGAWNYGRERVDEGIDGLGTVAEDALDQTVEIVEVVAETAVEVGVWAWEATNYVQAQVAQATDYGFEWAGEAAADVLHPVLDPILGVNTTNDLIEAGVDFGRVWATGGEAAVRDFVNQQVAAEAAGIQRRFLTEELGEQIGTSSATITHYGLLRAQGMDPLGAATAAGIDTSAEVLDLVETSMTDLIGTDGAAAASAFARDLMTTYGQQASDLANRSGLEQYGEQFDPSNPMASAGAHTPGWTATPGEIDQLQDSGSEFFGEGLEALFEPIAGQEAAEAIGEYGPRVGMEVVRVVASGGLSGGETAVLAGRVAFEAATGEEFESFIGNGVRTEFAEVLGEDGAALLGDLTESGLRLGLSYAGSHAGADAGPDRHLTDIDVDDVTEVLVDLGKEQFERITGADPDVVNRLYVHLGNDNWDQQDTQDLLQGIRAIVPEDQQNLFDGFVALQNDDTRGATEAFTRDAPEELRERFQQALAQEQQVVDTTGTDPYAGQAIFDRLGLSQSEVNDMLAADEAARGVEPFEPSGNPPQLPPGGDEDVFQALTRGLDIDPTDPAAPLVAHAVALQDTIALLEATGGAAAQPAIAQARSMLNEIGDQIDLAHAPGPVIPSAATELAAQQAAMQTASQSLQALAAQGGQAGAAAQQAQVLVTQAQRAFIDNAGDADAIVAAQQSALAQAMGMVQSAAIGAPFAQAQAITSLSEQTTAALAEAQGHTAAAHGLAPPPPPPPEATQEGALGAQQSALAEANATLVGLAQTPGPMGAAAQQAQALIAQAQAVTGDDPDTVAATQQQLLGAAQAAISGAAGASVLMGDPGAAATGGLVTGMLGQASAMTPMAQGVVPEPPDPYQFIDGQNAALQASLTNLISTNVLTNPATVQAAQSALSVHAAQQANMVEVREELEEARAELAQRDLVAEGLAEQARDFEFDDDAIAAVQARVGPPVPGLADPLDTSPANGRQADGVDDGPPSISDELQDSLVVQSQVANQALTALVAQNPQAAGVVQQAQASLAEAQSQLDLALAGQGIPAEVALVAQQQALATAMQTIGAAGGVEAPAAVGQLGSLLSQSQAASAQIRDRIAQRYGDERADPAAALQTAMATQHQVVDQTLQAMMGGGPQAMMASQQAQGILAGAQAQITALAAQGPGALTADQAAVIQQQAYAQALSVVATSGGPGAAATQSLQTLVAQTQQAAELRAGPPIVVDDPAVPGFAIGEPVPGQPIGDAAAAEDDFDDDIMGAHLREPAADPQADVMDRLDPDGDGQINSGIRGPDITDGSTDGLRAGAATDAADDPMGDMDWEEAQGDALTGELPAEPIAAPAQAAPAPAAPPVDAPDPAEAAPVEEPPPPPAPEPVPAEPVDVPEPDPAPPPEPEPVEEPPPPPEPEPPAPEDDF